MPKAKTWAAWKAGDPPRRELAASAVRRARDRAVNRWYDLRAVTAGYCNHSPVGGTVSPVDVAAGMSAGYAHWRCALPWPHIGGMHRYREYVWDDAGEVDYLPTPAGWERPAQPARWERRATPSARQVRFLATAERVRAARRDAARVGVR